MSKLLLFYPEHDLALAAGNSNYTAPAAALKLRRAGMALPLWIGDRGDMVCAGALPADWYQPVSALFNIQAQPYDHGRHADLEAAPWGWSMPACKTLVEQGFDSARLPDRERLEAIRQLSHRRSAVRLNQLLAGRLQFEILPGAQEVTDLADAAERLANCEALIAKLPWSSSGRGLLDSRFYPADDFIRFASGMVRRQGSVMIEPAYDRLLDFALLYEAAGNGVCEFAGFSVFETEGQGQYKANVLAEDEALRDRIASFVGAEKLDALVAEVGRALGEMTAGVFRGALGVDMLIAKLPDGQFGLHATVEINFRATMGLVARRLYDKYVLSGATGRFYIRPEQPSDRQSLRGCKVTDGRLASGTLTLNPPGSGLSFIAEVE